MDEETKKKTPDEPDMAKLLTRIADVLERVEERLGGPKKPPAELIADEKIGEGARTHGDARTGPDPLTSAREQLGVPTPSRERKLGEHVDGLEPPPDVTRRYLREPS
ncbi:MAG: hypothetical protein RLP09_04325 [Sandaracinaceae bacterium]